MLGILDILCRGVLPFLLLGFRLYSVWELPVFLRLRLVLLRKVHDVCWGLWIFCVVVYYSSYFWDFAQRFLCLSLLIGPFVRTPPQPPSTPVVQNIAEIPEPTPSP